MLHTRNRDHRNVQPKARASQANLLEQTLGQRLLASPVCALLLFGFVDLVIADVIPNGGSIMGEISSNGEIDTHTFSGVAGQAGIISISGSVSSGEFYQVFDPDDKFLASGSSHNRIDLTQTGTYTVVVRSSQPSGTGTYVLHLALAPGANEHGQIPNGGSRTETIDDDGEIDSFTFLGSNAATGTLTIDGSVGSGEFFYVCNPDGSLLVSSSGTASLDLTQSGTHTVVVRSSGPTGTGEYTLSLDLIGNGCLNLSVANFVAGEHATFTITGGTPGARAVTVYGVSLGETVVNGTAGYCATFGIDGVHRSRILGGFGQTFDANGEISFNVFIPSSASGRTILLQSAERATCPGECVSNLVLDTVW